jgi:RNA polymerase sigma factor (sigma-70 family)
VNARRLVRKDLGTISPARAQEVLDECEPAIRSELQKAGRCLGFVHGMGLDDLHAIAQVAALEASLTYRPEMGRSLRSWASQTVRWRLAEAIRMANHPETAADDPVVTALEELESPEESLENPESILNGKNPEELVIEAQHADWVQTAVGRLPPRQRTIVSSRMLGESMRLTASFLGITVRQVYYDAAEAYESLRTAARTSGYVE